MKNGLDRLDDNFLVRLSMTILSIAIHSGIGLIRDNLGNIITVHIGGHNMIRGVACIRRSYFDAYVSGR
jgi:hypothetical protein